MELQENPRLLVLAASYLLYRRRRRAKKLQLLQLKNNLQKIQTPMIKKPAKNTLSSITNLVKRPAYQVPQKNPASAAPPPQPEVNSRTSILATVSLKPIRAPNVITHNEKIHYNYYDTTLYDEENEMFYKYLTMETVFNDLLKAIETNIARKIHAPDYSLSSATRLAVTLRYLCTGESNVAIAERFKLGKSTVCGVLSETCQAIWDNWSDVLIPNLTNSQWLKIAKEFENNYKFPHCLGPVGSIKILNPLYSGINLLASCDINYKFTYIALAVIESSSSSVRSINHIMLNNMLSSKDSNIPKPCHLANSKTILPYIFTGDTSFSLHQNVMVRNESQNNKFGVKVQQTLTHLHKTFEIFKSKWRFTVKTQLKKDNLLKSVKAAICLHNFIVDYQNRNLDNINCLGTTRKPFDIIEIDDDDNASMTTVNYKKMPEEIRNDFIKYFQRNSQE